MIKVQKKNLKKQKKHITFYQIKSVNKIMIILVTRPLKMEEEVALEILISRDHSQIFLKICSVIFLVAGKEVEVEVEKIQTIEDLT